MKKTFKKLLQNFDMILILALLVAVLYQVVIEFDFIMHKSMCMDIYAGRHEQFMQCLADYKTK